MSTRRINFWATLVVLMGIFALRGGGSEAAAQCNVGTPENPENLYIHDIHCDQVPQWVYDVCEGCNRAVACVPWGQGVVVSCVNDE